MDAGQNRAANSAGVSAILIASLMWGTTGTAASFIPGIPPATIGAAAMGIGGVILGLTAVRGVRRVLRTPGALPLVLLGALALASYTLVFYVGMAWAGVALGNVLALGSAPLFAGLIEWIVDRRRVSGRWILATAIAVIGGVLLVVGRDHSADRRVVDLGVPAGVPPGVAPNYVVAGIAIALLAGLSYAVYTFVAARLIASRPAAAPVNHRAVISSIQVVAALPLILVLAFTAGPVIAQPLSWGILLYLAIFPTAIGHSLLAFSLGRMRASTSTVFSLFEPVVAVMLAATIVGEAITPVGWLGLAVVIAGLALLSTPTRRP
ncbi:EamA family transporter [Alpinimonas psychrophila]|uniref:DME family drug/metabolite transporter n=1 Tax=Alpinimonas psychrophila TaxID=748908 RepID=A0A7W3PNL5_9MICO|nr:DME family drug/metabolite transporter [Alpinimonas psychrophila]